MGRSLSLASPYYASEETINPTPAKITVGPTLSPQEQITTPIQEKEIVTGEEEIRPRPEKKRKPEHFTSPSSPLPQAETSANISFDSLAFVPGENRKTYQRRRNILRRRSIAELIAEGNQSGEGESNSPRAAAASLKPPNQE
ncbi:unnamed protein product [Linum trigynum]|uniref:Uncharacterized protein n=1 Tax=Linum trigynum TaxID=586398 RepID=A0AAV2EBE5_9ROSI